MSCNAVELTDRGVFLHKGRDVAAPEAPGFGGAGKGWKAAPDCGQARRGTITHGILAAHHLGESLEPGSDLHLRFDALASHDITYVGIIQTAAMSGLEAFPVPYILTNCHNSLCAVGGTINEDDHVFGLSAARKYGGIYVPPHLAVIHSYMRETWAGGGRMILGSDSHTRYGALGTLAVGEGGGELVKQLLSQSYDAAYPRVIAVYLEGSPQPSTGPMDVALALIGAVFRNGFAKNAVLEFVGPGIDALPMEYRHGIDVMTTETACWSSIWETGEAVRAWLTLHGRGADYRELRPAEWAWYDGLVKIALDKVRPMIALPFHPGNVYELEELLANPRDPLRRVVEEAREIFGSSVDPGLMEKIDSQGRIRVDQGIIAGCAGGTFDNIMAAAEILGGGAGRSGRNSQDVRFDQPRDCPSGASAGFSLSVYPGSQPVYLELARNGALASLAASGAVIKTAFCGPCFGAGDVPAHRGLSVRHTTRNFPSREGSRPREGQIASVALMDARSVAATARNGGILSSAEGLEAGPGGGGVFQGCPYRFDGEPYRARVYNGLGRPGKGELILGPNITPWPGMEGLGENLLLKVVSFITDPVTTTDELIPSGETSSYRSNPLALAEFTLSRRDPAYVGKAKALRAAAAALRKEAAPAEAAPGAPAEPERGSNGGADGAAAELRAVLEALGEPAETVQTASAIFAVKPGDGSAREQAASCQRVLGGGANFAGEYATRRYRSNLINWGIIPFIIEGKPPFQNGDYVFVPDVRTLIRGEKRNVEARILRPSGEGPPVVKGAGVFTLAAPELTVRERELLVAGSLINDNRNRRGARHGG
ncbi:MAG: hydratase [Treponema sp.]|jgi:aconitate hydratase|nr:hydratase [Treponema sp.]